MLVVDVTTVMLFSSIVVMPPPVPPSSAAQTTFPDASVVNVPPFVNVEQLKPVSVMLPDEPFVRTSVVAPVELPIVIVLAFAFVPRLRAAVPVESIVTAPPKMRLPEVRTGMLLPVGDCEGVNPPTVPALIAYPEETIRWRGARFSKLSAPSPAAQVAPTLVATSTFR